MQARSGILGERARKAIFLELFFDLAFVFALTRVAARMYERLTMHTNLSQVIVVLILALMHSPTMVASAAAAAVLAASAVADAWRAWERPPEPAAPPL